MEDILRRLNNIETAIMKLNKEVAMIKGKIDTTTMLVKWVIFPLLLIVAGLVGIKLTLPTI